MPTHGLLMDQHTHVHRAKPPKARTHIVHTENTPKGYVTFPHHSYCLLQYTEPSTISHCDENFSTHISAFTYHSLYNIISLRIVCYCNCKKVMRSYVLFIVTSYYLKSYRQRHYKEDNKVYFAPLLKNTHYYLLFNTGSKDMYIIFPPYHIVTLLNFVLIDLQYNILQI